AKPGMGGLLPAAKVTKAIAAARGVPIGQDVASPNGHSAFTDVDGLVTFVESVASATGLPVGIKSAVGQTQFWTDLTQRMADRSEGPDFIAVDGAEGGTGAGPLVFSDHVALPFWHAFAAVYSAFTAVELEEHVVFAGAGKLGLPSRAALALNLGVDLVNVGREAMLAAGCIQAQRCHTGHCPTGVATQSQWLERGLDPTNKGDRVGHYVEGLRKELTKLAHACGAEHPAMIGPDAVSVVCQGHQMIGAHGWYGIDPACTHPPARLAELSAVMAGL
ncbi:MAG: FMN-binding glutamate synthase family protein, partial [Actinomycetota bacterium]|nr:FMN-binding glutamate synthase family protein [Actinomycetota bacterium]